LADQVSRRIGTRRTAHRFEGLRAAPDFAGQATDGGVTRHGGYVVSQRIRKRIEEAFGWIKTVAGQRKTRFRGRGNRVFKRSISLCKRSCIMRSLLITRIS
jgi:hypothetical protein